MELNHHQEDPTQGHDEDEPDNEPMVERPGGEPVVERPSNDTIAIMVLQTVNNLTAMSEAEAWKSLWQLSIINRTGI